VQLTGAKGRRTVKAAEFFKGLYETAISPTEVLTAIRIPPATAESRYGFAEFARRRGDYAIVGLAATARADGQILRDVRLAYFGVGATPLRARNAEAALMNGNVDDAIAALARDLDPPDDIQASGRLKKYLAGVLLRRVVRQLAEKQP
jgi:carbon-monoxide dehydrogenase medium subunit